MSNEALLQHYGILGMKWGHRKDKKSSVRYKKADREVDEAMYGKRGAKRIEKRMKKGNSHTVASAKEMGRVVVRSLLGTTVATGVYADIATKGAIHKAAAVSAKDYIRKYATTKAKQRANSSLERIGQYTYKHIAGDVYERVMS